MARLVADGLALRGIDIQHPADLVEGHRTAVSTGGPSRLMLAVAGTGEVELEYTRLGSSHDPRTVADLATTLLTAESGPWEYRGTGYGLRGISPKGVVALELRARALAAELEVYEDRAFFDVTSGVRAINPQVGQDSEVVIDDTGHVTWNRDYWPEYVTIDDEPDATPSLGNCDEIAADVVATVSRFVGLLRGQ